MEAIDLCKRNIRVIAEDFRDHRRGALRIAKQPDNLGKTIVVILPDSGERYLSSALFEGLFDEKSLAV